MRETEPRDVAAMLVMGGGLVIALIVANAGRWLQTLGDLATSPPVVATMLAVPVVLLALLVVRWKLVGRALGRRSRVRMVPTDDFDPEVESVVRFASGLGRTRRAIHCLLTGPASAVRVRLAPDDAGRLTYELDVPAHARGAVASAGYDEVEQHDVDPSVDVGQSLRSNGSTAAVARVELVLARSSTAPLRDIGLTPDPLAAVARALSDLDTSAEDAVEVSVDLLPVTAARRERARRKLLRQASREHRPPTRSPWDQFLDGGSPRSRGARPDELVARRSGQRALTSKLGSPEPLFEIQVLIEARAASRGRAVLLARRLADTFDQFAGENYFRASGIRLPGGVAFLGADSRLRRGRFDRRMATGRFRPARRRIVTASEIAGLLKPPTVHCGPSNVVRSGGMIPAPPPGLPTFTGQPDLLPLGCVRTRRGDRRVGVPLRDTFFSYMGGRSRYGKTETALTQFLHVARSGHGCFFLDPHEDAIQKAKAYLTDHGLAERVIEINLADTTRQPGWNLFAVHGLPVERRAERVDAIVDAFAAALGWDESNTRALNLVTQSAQALTDLAVRLPPELAPTLFQIPTLLGNATWRKKVLPFVSRSTRQFFDDRFDRLSPEAITPVTNLVDRLRLSPSVAALLGSPVSTYDVRAAMDRGQIVLACPGTGSVRDRLVAAFLVYDLLHAAKTRANVPPEQRRSFWIWLDEVQTYDGGSAGTLAALLEQTAKYGIRASLLNQNPERLSPATLNAISTNRSHLMATALAAKAAGLVTREWGGAVKPEVVTSLERYTYLASVTLAGQVSRPFLVHGVSVDDAFPDAGHPERRDDLEATIDRTIRRRPLAESLAALDRHDDAITDALKRLTPTSTPTPTPTPAPTPPVPEQPADPGGFEPVRAQQAGDQQVREGA